MEPTILEHAPATQALTVAEVPVIRSIVVGRVDVQAYAAATLQEAEQRYQVASAAFAEAVAGQSAARRAQEPTQAAGWSRARTARERKLIRARAFLDAVRAGYLPIPRLPTRPLGLIDKLIPPAALDALADAKETGYFERFVLADGEAERWATNGMRSGRKRDPILIGIVDGEMVPIAWWR